MHRESYDEALPNALAQSTASASRLNGIVGRAMRRLTAPLRYGHLVMQMPNGFRIDHRAPQPGPHAIIELRRWRALLKMLLKGDLGFAESYMDGDWSSPDLCAVMELGAHNQPYLAAAFRSGRLLRLGARVRHALRSNSRRGSRRNIEQHYDLGNAFYAAWLDAEMTYSSALFTTGTETLEDAQEAKLDRIVALLGLSGGEDVLEIGCGWGRLAEKLAGRRAGAITGVTLSPAQLAYGRDRLRRSGLDGRARLELRDYRDIAHHYDRIVSIEMIEAVGEQYWPRYFATLRSCLRPGGVAVLQVISIAPDRYDAYRADCDFIQRYIFPGGMLPTPAIVRRHAEDHGLCVESIEYFGESYARTLAEWRRRFEKAWPEIEAHGYSARFRRMWNYYLAYCEAGFRAKALDVGLYRLVRKDDS